jgi:uncharacterized protein YndB with AHSA1/START domain
MVTWKSTTFIARSAQEVFDYISDVRNDPNWHTDVHEATVIGGNGSVQNGTVFDVKARVSGTEEIVVYDAPHKVVLRGSDMGKMVPTDTRTVTPVDGGVEFTRHVEVEASGFMGFMMKMMTGMAARRNDKFVENLKSVLEGT